MVRNKNRNPNRYLRGDAMRFNGQIPLLGQQNQIQVMPGCDVVPGPNAHPHTILMQGQKPDGTVVAKHVQFGGLTKLEHVAAEIAAAAFAHYAAIRAEGANWREFYEPIAVRSVDVAEAILAECHKRQWPTKEPDAPANAQDTG